MNPYLVSRLPRTNSDFHQTGKRCYRRFLVASTGSLSQVFFSPFFSPIGCSQLCAYQPDFPLLLPGTSLLSQQIFDTFTICLSFFNLFSETLRSKLSGERKIQEPLLRQNIAFLPPYNVKSFIFSLLPIQREFFPLLYLPQLFSLLE